MFTAYLKYISLLLISGLILTFYRAAIPSAYTKLKAIRSFKAGGQRTGFSFLKDVILPLFPVLNTADLCAGNKK